MFVYLVNDGSGKVIITATNLKSQVTELLYQFPKVRLQIVPQE